VTGKPPQGSSWQPQPIDSTGNATDIIADQIRMAIISGALPAGKRLPGESDLARQLNVSRGTVREALQQLATQSLILTTRGVNGGSFVTHPSPAYIQRSLGTSLAILAGADVATVEWMNEAREMLEVPAAGLAAIRHHATDLAAIDATLDSQATVDHETAETQHNFHAAVVKATGNSMLEIMLRPIFEVLDSKVASVRFTPKFVQEIDADHRRIANAIRKRDSALAEKAMLSHLTRLRKHYEMLWAVRPKNGGSQRTRAQADEETTILVSSAL
jgi:GntR family transcriptional regulator, transcriptional repressor for pyruvate dehydrogenase complex